MSSAEKKMLGIDNCESPKEESPTMQSQLTIWLATHKPLMKYNLLICNSYLNKQASKSFLWILLKHQVDPLCTEDET